MCTFHRRRGTGQRHGPRYTSQAVRGAPAHITISPHPRPCHHPNPYPKGTLPQENAAPRLGLSLGWGETLRTLDSTAICAVSVSSIGNGNVSRAALWGGADADADTDTHFVKVACGGQGRDRRRRTQNALSNLNLIFCHYSVI
jgi:hypothetical protein